MLETRICFRCGQSITVRNDGKLFDHYRYVDGGGWRPDQDHTMIPCEGED